MNREECLEAALDCISNTRNEQYGDLTENFSKIAQFWSVYLSIDINALEVSQMMVLLKVARSIKAPKHSDNYIDQGGYSGASCELAEKL